MSSLNPFSFGLFSTVQFTAAAALLLTELILIIVVMRNPDQGKRMAHFIASLCVGTPMVIIGLICLGVHAGRLEMIQAIEGIDPSQKATLLSSCSGLCVSQAQAFFGGLLLAASGLFGGICVSVFYWKTHPAGPQRRIIVSAALGVGTSLVFFGMGMTLSLLEMNRDMSALAAVDIYTKLPLLLKAINEAASVAEGALAGSVLVVVSTGVFIILLSKKMENDRSRSVGLIASICVLAVGGVAFTLTRDHATDILRSVPIAKGGEIMFNDPDIHLPRLVNAKPLSRAPVIAVSSPRDDPFGGVITLDGHELYTVKEVIEDSGDPWFILTRLKKNLEVKKANWKMINREETFPGAAILQADKDTPMKILAPVFSSTVAAGYQRLHLATMRSSTLKSSVMGEIHTNHCYDVAVSLVGLGEQGIKLDPHGTYAAFAKIADEEAAKKETIHVVVGQ